MVMVAGRSTQALAINVKYPELQPLLDKVDQLRAADSSDIREFVTAVISSSQTPTMAQAACDKIIARCHPKDWGDRFVSEYADAFEWNRYLDDLSGIAEQCGQLIYDHAAVGGVDG
jgi:hypothetical protein